MASRTIFLVNAKVYFFFSSYYKAIIRAYIDIIFLRGA